MAAANITARHPRQISRPSGSRMAILTPARSNLPRFHLARPPLVGVLLTLAAPTFAQPSPDSSIGEPSAALDRLVARCAPVRSVSYYARTVPGTIPARSIRVTASSDGRLALITSDDSPVTRTKDDDARFPNLLFIKPGERVVSRLDPSVHTVERVPDAFAQAPGPMHAFLAPWPFVDRYARWIRGAPDGVLSRSPADWGAASKEAGLGLSWTDDGTLIAAGPIPPTPTVASCTVEFTGFEPARPISIPRAMRVTFSSTGSPEMVVAFEIVEFTIDPPDLDARLSFDPVDWQSRRLDPETGALTVPPRPPGAHDHAGDHDPGAHSPPSPTTRQIVFMLLWPALAVVALGATVLWLRARRR